MHGLIALVRDRTRGAILADAGADVRWRCHDRADGEDMPWGRVWLPICALISSQERSAQPVHRGVARRS